MRLFLDTNVVLDVLVMREPHWRASSRVLAHAEKGKHKAFIAAHGVTTLHYLLSKHLNRRKARAAIVQLLNLAEVAAVDHQVILEALSLGWSDFEDAVQAAAALHARATHLITRNPKDFSNFTVPVMTPEEFLRGIVPTE